MALLGLVGSQGLNFSSFQEGNRSDRDQLSFLGEIGAAGHSAGYHFAVGNCSAQSLLSNRGHVVHSHQNLKLNHLINLIN